MNITAGRDAEYQGSFDCCALVPPTEMSVFALQAGQPGKVQ